VRPVLIPAARRLWRGQETLQLADLVLEGLDLPRRQLLPLLDGSRTREQVVSEATAFCPDAAEVLDLLEDAGLLLDADVVRALRLDREDADRLGPDVASLTLVHGRRAGAALQGRRQARVVVHGTGRVADQLGALLEQSGVGSVEEPGASTRRPALIVLTEDDVGETAALLTRDGLPHLLAGVRERRGVVGPLVLPGSAPCLHCLDLVRTEIDPGWPILAAQAALQVLELLEGGTPGSVGGTLELTLPGWRWRRRSWPRHPGCPCAWAMQVNMEVSTPVAATA
jgi:hypothetical protein